MDTRKELFLQLLRLIPDLQEWSERTGRVDGGNVPKHRTLKTEGRMKVMALEVEMVGGDSYQGVAWQCRLAVSHSTRDEAGQKLSLKPRMELAVSFEHREAVASTYEDGRVWDVWRDGRNEALEKELSSFLSQWLSKALEQGYKTASLVEERQQDRNQGGYPTPGTARKQLLSM